MSWIRFNMTLMLVVVVSLAAALVQGRMRHRWGQSDAVRAAAVRLQEFPQDFGDWHMVSVRDLDEDSRNQLECVSATDRVYCDRKTGGKVILLLILGPTGPTAAHTPEICIGERDFAPLGERRELAVGRGNDHFWNKRFKSKSVHGESMSVSWAWNADGHWIAAKDARYTIAGIPFLYKAQVTCNIPASADGDSNDGQRFLADFVPVAANYIVPDLKD